MGRHRKKKNKAHFADVCVKNGVGDKISERVDGSRNGNEAVFGCPAYKDENLRKSPALDCAELRLEFMDKVKHHLNAVVPGFKRCRYDAADFG